MKWFVLRLVLNMVFIIIEPLNRLVHSIDLDDESPNGNSEKKVTADGLVEVKDSNQSCQPGIRIDSAGEDGNRDSIREPFSGDLQLVLSERDERDSPIVKRKRRKLPEIPKTPSRRCTGFSKKKNIWNNLYF